LNCHHCIYSKRWCDEIEHSDYFWKIEPPQPTTAKTKLSAESDPDLGTGKFLRYIGGKIQRSCLFLFSKRDFDRDGTPRAALPQSVLPKLSMQEMKSKLSEVQWDRIVKIMLRADIPGGCHAITLQTVIDVLVFWGAGPQDCILDIGSGMGSTTAIAAISLGARAIGLEYREDVYNTVYDVLSSINGIINT
jgi:hypothetical protein